MGLVQEDEEDIDDFIDYEDGLEVWMNKSVRRGSVKGKKKERQRRRAMANRPQLSGINAK